MSKWESSQSITLDKVCNDEQDDSQADGNDGQPSKEHLTLYCELLHNHFLDVIFNFVLSNFQV